MLTGAAWHVSSIGPSQRSFEAPSNEVPDLVAAATSGRWHGLGSVGLVLISRTSVDLVEHDPRHARVVIVDDQRSFADALTLALSLTEDLRVVGVAPDAKSGFDLVVAAQPDLLVTDYRLSGSGNGIDLASRVRALSAQPKTESLSETPILVLTGYAAPQVLRGAESLDAVSVVSKDHPISELVAAFRRALSGESEVAEPFENVAGLTKAELEVLELLGQGRQAAQIADDLYLSLHAIRFRIKTTLRKLDVTSQLEAVAKATSLGLLVPPSSNAAPAANDPHKSDE